MTTIEDLYLGVIRAGITRHPRSLQKRIGPSEIGRPCDRWMLHKLNGDEEPDRGPAWKPAIGTAVHAQLEEWFDAANTPAAGGDVTNWEWVTEAEVTVGRIGDTAITGHSDLFHVRTGTVIDHKVVGTKQLAHYRLHGPSEQYRTQAHLYGKGFTDDGGWGPCREVAIAFLPRDGELAQAHIWHEAYDPHRAADALGRANRLWTLLHTVGIDAALAARPLCDDQWCMRCRVERRTAARAAGQSLFADLDAVARPADYAPGSPELRAAAQPPRAAASAIPIRPAVVASCTVCGQPMSPIVVLGGYTTHPSCDPEAPDATARPVPATPLPAGLAPVTNLFDR